MSKGTKSPSNTPEGTTQNYRGINGNTLHLSDVLRPGASLCPKDDRDIAESIRGTGYHPGPSSLFTPHHHERSASAHSTRG
jgi:hypothetical protein